MLTRLTPRGTSSAAFVKKTRALQLSTYKSLRGRDISVSSEEEEEEVEGGSSKDEEKKKSGGGPSSAGSAKKNTPPKRKLKTRKASDAIERKGSGNCFMKNLQFCQTFEINRFGSTLRSLSLLNLAC